MNLKSMCVAAAVVFAAGATAGAQQAVTKAGETLKATVTIQQIDSTARLVTYRTSDGKEDTVWAGPEMLRFNELKVGDKVNLTYYESKVFKVRKPGDPPLAVGTGGEAITRSTGALPGATVAKQTVSTVTVQAVDAGAGTITVTTSTGRVITRKVDDKSNLNGVKVGDRIDIVSTEAMMASVERAQ